MINADETYETEAGTIKNGAAGNISEILTYRSNISSNRGKTI